MAIRRSEAVDLPLGFSDAYAHCLGAGQALGRAMVSDEDEQAGAITLKVPMTFKSWGERVTLQLENRGASATTVEITSRSAFALTLIDYGKNAQNVRTLADWLMQTAAGELRPGAATPSKLRPATSDAPPQDLWAPYRLAPPVGEQQAPRPDPGQHEGSR